ncbi:MAG: hypothetical protein AAF371_05440 [Pseudomonadota bacterium]
MADAEMSERETEDPEALVRDPLAGEAFFERSRLMVVAIDKADGGGLKWKAQVAPSGPWGNTWIPIGDGSYVSLAGGATCDGRVALAALPSDGGGLRFIVEATEKARDAKRWDAPVDLDLPPGVTGFSDIAMIRDAGGRIEIFAVDAEAGRIWWIFENPPRVVEKTEEVIPPGQTKPITVHVHVPAPPLTPWSDWQSFGEPVSHISVTSLADDRIALFANGYGAAAGAVYRSQQTKAVATEPSDWAPFVNMDDAASGPAASAPVAALDREGALNLFVIGADGQVIQRRQTPPGSETWGPWIRPGMAAARMTMLAAGIGGTGAVTLIAADAEGTLYANQQINARHQQWSDWGAIATASGLAGIGTDYTADGGLVVFAAGAGIRALNQAVPEATSWEAAFTTLSDSFDNLVVVRDLIPPDPGYR